MWIAETLEADGNITSQFLLKGPICRVGRHSDNCLSFPQDKSISRSHAELSIVDKKLVLRDMGSKFGTVLDENKEKVDSTKDPLELASGQVVKFGAINSRVRFVRVTMSLCLTRLDKKDKDRVKAAAQTSGSKIVSAAEDATHIITNSISGATLKIIIGLVLKKSIVTTDWLSFLFTEKPSELIPSPDLFFPPVEDNVGLVDRDRSRNELMKGYLVIVTRKSDNQYFTLMQGCGAQIIHSYEMDEDAVNESIDQLSDSDKQVVCTFWDEVNADDIDEMHSPAKLWLTSTQLAAAVFNNTAPAPSRVMPIRLSQKISQRTYTQSQQANTQATQSQIFGTGKTPSKKHTTIKSEQVANNNNDTSSKKPAIVPSSSSSSSSSSSAVASTAAAAGATKPSATTTSDHYHDGAEVFPVPTGRVGSATPKKTNTASAAADKKKKTTEAAESKTTETDPNEKQTIIIERESAGISTSTTTTTTTAGSRASGGNDAAAAASTVNIAASVEVEVEVVKTAKKGRGGQKKGAEDKIPVVATAAAATAVAAASAASPVVISFVHSESPPVADGGSPVAAAGTANATTTVARGEKEATTVAEQSDKEKDALDLFFDAKLTAASGSNASAATPATQENEKEKDDSGGRLDKSASVPQRKKRGRQEIIDDEEDEEQGAHQRKKTSATVTAATTPAIDAPARAAASRKGTGAGAVVIAAAASVPPAPAGKKDSKKSASTSSSSEVVAAGNGSVALTAASEANEPYTPAAAGTAPIVYDDQNVDDNYDPDYYDKDGGGGGDDGDDGWFRPVRGAKRKQVLQEKRRLFLASSEHNNNAGSSQAEAADLPIFGADEEIVEIVPRDHRAPSSSSSAVAGVRRRAAAVGGLGLRDVRKFRKNFVRKPDPEVIARYSEFELVLPKESEREIQLRLDREDEEVQLRARDNLFADNYNKPAGGTQRSLADSLGRRK